MPATFNPLITVPDGTFLDRTQRTLILYDMSEEWIKDVHKAIDQSANGKLSVEEGEAYEAKVNAHDRWAPQLSTACDVLGVVGGKVVKTSSGLPLLKQKDHKRYIMAEVAAAKHRGIVFKTKRDVAKWVAKQGKYEINQDAVEALYPRRGDPVPEEVPGEVEAEVAGENQQVARRRRAHPRENHSHQMSTWPKWGKC